MGLTIWSNARLDAAARLLAEGVRGHRLILAREPAVGARPGGLGGAEVAFGRPAPADCLASPKLRWIAVTAAGYTPYDTPEFREAMTARGTVLTNASEVYADPCAQQVLASMLALGRGLLSAHREQLGARGWIHQELRREAGLLTGQTAVLLGYGAIGRRLVELLAPFKMNLCAVRRRRHSESGVRIIAEEQLSAALAEADHVVNLLPENTETRGYMNARRFACCRRGARFYNVGRGATVDENALREALESGRIGAAYLDVFATEPLPPAHPLWTLPNCHVTPHSAGGRPDEDSALVRHFLRNLDAFASGKTALTDRIF